MHLVNETQIKVCISVILSAYTVHSIDGWDPGYLMLKRPVITLISMHGCPDWSKSSLGARMNCRKCLVSAQLSPYHINGILAVID